MTVTAARPITTEQAAPTASRLRAEGVSLGYRDRTVVQGLDLSVPDGRVSAIVGPNGCGKSTLLRGLVRLLAPSAGQVVLDGEDISSIPTKEVARRIGLLPQAPLAPEGLSVAELVAHGRHPHQGLLRRHSAEDDAVVAEAMRLTDTIDLADRLVDELSGGQRQRDAPTASSPGSTRRWSAPRRACPGGGRRWTPRRSAGRWWRSRSP